MTSRKSLFVCQKCGKEAGKWFGQCPGCGEWNSLVETAVSSRKKFEVRGSKLDREVRSLKLDKINTRDTRSLLSGISEFDQVVGKGFGPGQVVLLAGEPGIGKSTLLLQVADAVNSNLKSKKENILYISGEESPEQIGQRARRLGVKGEGIEVVSENDVDVVLEEVRSSRLEAGNEVGSSKVEKKSQTSNLKPQSEAYRASNLQFQTSVCNLLIIDSIQSLTTQDLSGTAGSIGQVRECANRIIQVAKSLNIPVILVGHITKEGSIAGPKVLEHMVDTVLYLEGDKKHLFRILRTTKNRFGDASEVGVFEMKEKGMIEVKNPSDSFWQNVMIKHRDR